jgi:hypothetical protein
MITSNIEMVASNLETPIAPVVVRITSHETNSDWLVIQDLTDVYPLKPGEHVEMMYTPGTTIFGLTGKQAYTIEYLICN